MDGFQGSPRTQALLTPDFILLLENMIDLQQKSIIIYMVQSTALTVAPDFIPGSIFMVHHLTFTYLCRPTTTCVRVQSLRLTILFSFLPIIILIMVLLQDTCLFPTQRYPNNFVSQLKLTHHHMEQDMTLNHLLGNMGNDSYGK